ncbi:MAG: hypothetical protein ABIH86_01640 [Planctomycetota bacterium]
MSDKSKRAKHSNKKAAAPETRKRELKRKKPMGLIPKVIIGLVVVVLGFGGWLIYQRKIDFNQLFSRDGIRDAGSTMLDEAGKLHEETSVVVKSKYEEISPILKEMADKAKADFDSLVADYKNIKAERQKREQEAKRLQELDAAETARREERFRSDDKYKDTPKIAGVMGVDQMSAVVDKRAKLGETTYAVVNDIEKDESYKTIDFTDAQIEKLKENVKDEEVKVFRFSDVSEYSEARSEFNDAAKSFNAAAKKTTSVEETYSDKRAKDLESLRQAFVDARDEFDEAGRLFETVESKALSGGATGPQMQSLNQQMDAYAQGRNACVEQIVIIEREIRTNADEMQRASADNAGDSALPTVSIDATPSESANPIFNDPNYSKGDEHYKKGAKIYDETMKGAPSNRDQGYVKAQAELEKADTYWTKIWEKYGDDPKYAKHYPDFDSQYQALNFLLYACRKSKSLKAH